MFPCPDVGVEDFPAADAGLSVFPGPDVGVEEFPPTPVMLIYADAALTMTPTVGRVVVPWRTADASLAMAPGAEFLASVSLGAAAGLAMSPIAAVIPDEVFPEVAFTMTPTAVREHAAVVDASAVLSMSPGMAGVPVAVVTADAITTMSVAAAVEIAGIVTAAAGLAMAPACAPVASIAAVANASFAMTPSVTYEVVTFVPSGMTKSGPSARPGTSYTQVAGGWAPDTTGYPGSSVVTDDLIIQRSSTGITIDTSVVWTNHVFGTRTVTMRLVNATTSATIATMSAAVSIAASSTATAALTATGVTVTAGDHIRLEALSSNINSISAQANSASYVRAYLPG